MTTIESAEYYINRAAKLTEFKDIDAIYYLGYYAAGDFALDLLVQHIEHKAWTTLIDLTKYNSQDDVYWIVGFRSQSSKYYLAIINDHFEIMYREQFVYTKGVSAEEFASIPFVLQSELMQPLNPTFFLTRLYRKLFT